MEVTEVRISRRTQGDAKLKGYAAVTFDDVFVVRDLKIIEGRNGLFVAMPSQKIQEPCSNCKKKNALRSKFCNECGQKLAAKNRDRRDLHRDIAHPINSEMRAYLQKVIIEAYKENQNSIPIEDEDANTYQSEDEGDIIDENGAHEEEDYLSRPSLSEEERVTKEEDEQQGLIETID